MLKTLTAQRLLALFAAGWLIFNFPLQQLWATSSLALFVWWAVLIALLAVLMERGQD